MHTTSATHTKYVGKAQMVLNVINPNIIEYMLFTSGSCNVQALEAIIATCKAEAASAFEGAADVINKIVTRKWFKDKWWTQRRTKFPNGVSRMCGHT